MSQSTLKEGKKKPSIPEIKKALKQYEKDALITMLVDCYKSSKDVKNYIHVLLHPEDATQELYENARKQIENEFFPLKGYGKLRLAKAKSAISEFKKLSNDELRTLDLMIYYVEQGVDFTVTYGDISEAFYSSMESMYTSVLNKIGDSVSKRALFNARLLKIVNDTDGIGWGFHDYLAGEYYEWASSEED
ncbi:DUF6155 family protein [Paenibacillus chungangensis]|uniref:DUF6155 family protein n=1 Tax=Paenibacillus chungangensis TaxID=696535 RepID=A0ABW3HWE8_9BACL